jgi:uncharacterized protein YecT (DUF1311 family)
MFRQSAPGPVFAITFVLAGASAHGEAAVDCGYPLTDAERSFCADQALTTAKAEMTAAYDLLTARVIELDAALPEELRGAPAALSAAQDAWADYAEKDCRAYAFPFMGGPPGPELFRNCMIVLTRKRTEDLDATLQDYSN